MTNINIDTLNDVTKTLIDSQKGYEKACEMCADTPGVKAEFRRRADERQALVNQFQQHVRTLGGTPETSGGVAGAVHRGFTQFASLFQNDQKAAFSAIDDGEEHLAETIEKELKHDGLTVETRQLLQNAHAQAKAAKHLPT